MQKNLKLNIFAVFICAMICLKMDLTKKKRHALVVLKPLSYEASKFMMFKKVLEHQKNAFLSTTVGGLRVSTCGLVQPLWTG